MRVLSRRTPVSSAMACLREISSETRLASPSTSMAPWSSRMLPSLSLSVLRIWSSMSLSCRLLSAASSTSRSFSACISGRSLATTMPSSWSCSPSGVIMKLSSVTLTETSGM